MKQAITFLCCLFSFYLQAQTTKDFTMRTVKCGMQMPWEITYGPDGFLWTTEARGYRVSRVNPVDGNATVLLDLSNNKNFANYPTVSPQGGLMGLALHPQLLSGKPYVYLAYVYNYVNSLPNTGGDFFKTKVVRYTYNAGNQTLTNEEVLCDTIPGSSDHNGGRMTIAPVNGQNFLFYSVGDMGAGQFGNANRHNNAQDTKVYEGKILRFNLESDGDIGVFDKWNPNDNPFNNAIWSFGHRNPQGLVNVNGNLFEAEHGPYSDDELNLIQKAANYGHPLVVGLADGNYNGAAVGFGTGVPIIQDEVANANALGAAYRNPLKSFFPETNANVRAIYQNYVNNTIPANNYFLSWNSIAPSGIDYYNSSAIPNWKNSILITSLKRRRIYRLQLDANSQTIVSDTLPLFEDMGRYRDIALSPDGTKIYVSCDSEGQTSGPTLGTTIDPPNKGCILEFTYNPPVVNTNSCRYQDSLTLVSLYNSTNGSNWTNKWDLTKPMDTWYGVILNGYGCVKFLLLANNNIIGTLPSKFDIPGLETLDISTNKISGQIPNFNLPTLVLLSMSENQFSGNIPNFNFPNLAQLSLNNNQLSGSIPNFNLPNLNSLSLEGNQLSESIPNFNLPNLGGLILTSNQLSGSIPNFNLPNLIVLYLDRNQLSGSIPNFNLQQINSLILKSNNLSGCIPAGLKNLCGKNVDISQNPNLATQDFATFCANNTGACTTTTTSCAAITATSTNNSITLSGLSNLNQVQVFNNAYSSNVFTQNFTTSTATIPNLTAGQTYHVKIQQYNTSTGAWVFVCDRTIDVTLSGTVDPCANDVTPPVLSGCPNNVTQLSDGTPSARSWVLPTATDNCSTPTVTSSAASDFFPVGVTPVTYTATDAKGNKSTCSFTVTITLQNTGSGCRYQDSLSLVSLYNSAGGLNWTNKWDLTKPITTWYGVSLNASGCVGVLNLRNNNIIGTIPTKFDISGLEILDLSANKISGQIPNFNMPILVQLSMSNNQLTGSIPNFNMPALGILALGENQLTGSIPNFNMPVLRGLELYNNNLTGNIPNFNSPNLAVFWLFQNQLSGTIPNIYAPNMNTFVLSDNKLTGTIPEFSFPNIQQAIDISNNQLSGCIPIILRRYCGTGLYFRGNPQLSTQDEALFCSPGLGACGGSPISNCDSISVKSNNNTIFINGLPSNSLYRSGVSFANTIQIFNNNYSANVFTQNIITSNINIPNLTTGQTYHVKVQIYNTSTGAWVFVCDRTIDVTVNGVTNNNSCRYLDSLSLVSLYNSTNGANWVYRWDLTKPMDTWTGIILNGAGCVTDIRMANGLKGTLPNFYFSELRTLQLDNNLLTGTIPNFNLPNLNTLNLSYNQLSGSIPNFSGMQNLKMLNLSQNALVGNIPNFSLPNLTDLYLPNNQLSGSIPNFNLPNLNILTLSYNQLSGSIPNFSGVPNLTQLYLQSNQLTGTIPNFSGVRNLSTLYLSYNQLTGSIPNFNLPVLNVVDVSSNQLTGCIPTGLKYLCGKVMILLNNPNLATQDFAAFCANNTGACVTITGGCAAITATSTGNAITLSGLSNLNQVQVFNNTYSANVFTQNFTTSTATIPNLASGQTYHVKIQQYNTSTGAWVFVCERTIDVTTGNTTTSTLPDLTLANLNLGATTVAQAQILNWKVDIKNIGTRNASGNFNVKAYFSKDNVLSSDDIQSGIIPTGGYAAGFSVPQVASGSLALNTIPIGQYYLILKVDADNQVQESDENNNVLVSASPVSVTAPVVSNACDGITVATTGNIITVSGLTNLNSFQVFNNSWSTRVFSQTTTANTLTIPNLTAGQTYHVKIQNYNTSTGAWVFVCERTIDVIAGTGIAPKLAQQTATQFIPIIINKITPNPTDGDVTVEIESLKEQQTGFSFFNMLGTQVRNESRTLDKGINQIHFDVSELPSGIYLVAPQTNEGRVKTSVFVKN